MGDCRLRTFHPAKLDRSQATDYQRERSDRYPLPAKPRMLDLRVSPNLVGTFIQFLAQILDGLDLSQAPDTLENMNFKLILRGGTKLAIQVFSCEFVPV